MNENRMNRRRFLHAVGAGLACLALPACSGSNVGISGKKTTR